MKDTLSIQGRTLTPADLDTIRELIRSHPEWNRTRLSRELCAMSDWRAPTGQIKHMACRTLLLKLHRRALIELPALQGQSVNHRRGKAFPPVFHDTTPRHSSLAELGTLRLEIFAFIPTGRVPRLERGLQTGLPLALADARPDVPVLSRELHQRDPLGAVFRPPPPSPRAPRGRPRRPGGLRTR